MMNQTPDTREEAASKLPALDMIIVLRWLYSGNQDETPATIKSQASHPDCRCTSKSESPSSSHVQGLFQHPVRPGSYTLFIFTTCNLSAYPGTAACSAPGVSTARESFMPHLESNHGQIMQPIDNYMYFFLNGR